MTTKQLFLEQFSTTTNSDAEAVARLLELYRKKLLRWAEQELDHCLRSKIDPADVVQETLIRANAAFVHFQGTTTKELSAWMYTILDFTLAEYRRQFDTEKRDTHREVHEAVGDEAVILLRHLPHHDPTPSSFIRHKEDEERLQKILQLLPGRFRRVLEARHWGDKTYAEISQELRMTRPGARKLYQRALAEVRRLMWPVLG